MVDGRVSVIIPGRCEVFFQPTIDSALERAAGDVEVVAVIDGYEPDPPLVARDDRVKLIKLDKSIGQRAGYNLGVRESSGAYVMKIDAHALLSPGYDDALKAYCPLRSVVLPEMRRLNPHEWKHKPRGKTRFMYFGLDLYCHYWRDYRKREAAKVEYPEVMTGQGSCWFTTREWNDYIGLLDEGVGSWGNVGIEVSLRTWLCGGTQVLNPSVWQAHYFRKDEGGFPYPMDGRRVAKAHKYTRKNYYFNDAAFEHQERPFSWLIHKFAPVPGWEAYLHDGFTIPRTIIYYTDGHLDESLARAVRKNLTKVAAEIPIISVSQEPLRFGRNICVGEKPRSNRSIYEQILAGLEAAEPDSVIYLCEHDVAYAPAHFAHVPEVKERIEYNQNRYYWAPGQGKYLPARGKWPLSQLVAYREYLMEQVKRALENDAPSSELYNGVRTHRYESERPNVDIRHGKNFSRDGRFKREYYAGTAPNTVANIGHWGSPGHMLGKLGWHPEPEMLSILCRLLREHYGLTRFLPAPVRVKGLHRVDVSKLIGLMGLRKGAEIGVAGGQHSELMLQTIPDCELLCVDTWGTSWSKKLERPARKRLEPYGATIVKAESVDAARSVPDESLDFVYIDADHTFDHCMEDLIAWGRKVRSGGIVAGHDYDRPHKKGVVPAVDAYTKAHRIQEWFLTDQKREASYMWVKP
jgi:glycosyltransferase involved in cell wall biosynthesis/predicted O-methyltransferase YrrM